jgi:hypothetical protein
MVKEAGAHTVLMIHPQVVLRGGSIVNDVSGDSCWSYVRAGWWRTTSNTDNVRKQSPLSQITSCKSSLPGDAVKLQTAVSGFQNSYVITGNKSFESCPASQHESPGSPPDQSMWD